MLSKCANPGCSAAFHFLHEGRIFSLVRRPRQEPPSAAEAAWQNDGPSPVERYWLCDRCSQLMTLVYDGGAVVLKALPGAPPLPRHTLRPLPPGERTLAA